MFFISDRPDTSTGNRSITEAKEKDVVSKRSQRDVLKTTKTNERVGLGCRGEDDCDNSDEISTKDDDKIQFKRNGGGGTTSGRQQNAKKLQQLPNSLTVRLDIVTIGKGCSKEPARLRLALSINRQRNGSAVAFLRCASIQCT